MKTVYWNENALYAVDQTLIPYAYKVNRLETVQDICDQILTMGIRGATAIGVAGAFAIVSAAMESNTDDISGTYNYMQKEAEKIKNVRPTGRKLSYAVEKMMKFAQIQSKKARSKQEFINMLLETAQRISDCEEEKSKSVATNCADILKDGSRMITHCHTGPLASVNYGMCAGGAILAHEQGKKVHVIVDETRPRLQGAKINTFELRQHGVPFTLITDNMAGYAMANGLVNIAMAGADRVAANGDTAAKIGVYSLAILAKEHGIPFYMCATDTHIDFSIKSGREIEIEQRDPDEVRVINAIRMVAEDIPVLNPAFDVTPAKYLTGIITNEGIVYPPYEDNLKKLFSKTL
jgi:methylthioribose-1-phosphate isomerase